MTKRRTQKQTIGSLAYRLGVRDAWDGVVRPELFNRGLSTLPEVRTASRAYKAGLLGQRLKEALENRAR